MTARRLGICGASLAVLSACTSGSPHSAAAASGSPPSASRALISPLPASTTALRLPGPCSPLAVGRQVAQLLADVNAGDGRGAAQHFAADSLWEPYEHLDPPNGTAGGLATPAAIDAFVQELHHRGEQWTHGRLASPVGPANLPLATGYALSMTVVVDGASRIDGAKVAVDCTSGLILHMVGPIGHRG